MIKSIKMELLKLLTQNVDVIITIACAAFIRYLERKGLVNKYKKVIDELHAQLNDEQKKRANK